MKKQIQKVMNNPVKEIGNNNKPGKDLPGFENLEGLFFPRATPDSGGIAGRYHEVNRMTVERPQSGRIFEEVCNKYAVPPGLGLA